MNNLNEIVSDNEKLFEDVPPLKYVKRFLQIPELIEDAKRALRANALFSALSLSLSLAAECSKFKYPDEWFEEKADNDPYLMKQFPNYFDENGIYLHKKSKNHDKERFMMWFDDWNNSHNCSNDIKQEMIDFEEKNEEHRRNKDGSISPDINGEILYQIRCKLFHEGTNAIDFQNKIMDIGNHNIGDFNYVLTDASKPFLGIYGHSSSSSIQPGSSSMNIYLPELVNGLCYYVELYYSKNAPKSFNKIQVIDYTDVYKRNNEN